MPKLNIFVTQAREELSVDTDTLSPEAILYILNRGFREYFRSPGQPSSIPKDVKRAKALAYAQAKLLKLKSMLAPR